jgi:Ulp1 family protease
VHNSVHNSVQDEETAYARVSRWHNKVDLFAQDYLLVPIHHSSHWSLAIICQPGVHLHSVLSACILFFYRQGHCDTYRATLSRKSVPQGS